MSASRVHCNIGFGELAPSLPQEHVDNAVKVLIDMLRDVPHIEFDPCLSWTEWSLPDQLVYSTITALLKLSNSAEQYREAVCEAIFHFTKEVVQELNTGKSIDTVCQLAPAFHGLYRAIISNPFPWSIAHWRSLSLSMSALFATDCLEQLNSVVIEALHLSSEDLESPAFPQTFMARYMANGRPLTGYFIICCVVEIEWTVLAQVLSSSSVQPTNAIDEAAAANTAWLSLMHNVVHRPFNLTDDIRRVLKATLQATLQSFSDLQIQMADLDHEPSSDSYAWETMAESLKLAAICSVALEQLDDTLFSLLKLLLSEKSPVTDNLIQESALKATTVLVRNFPFVAAQMTSHLRRFVTAPLEIFELQYVSEIRAPPPLSAAARCLALCIKLAPGDDLILSNMYSLLNYIAATGQDSKENSIHLSIPQDSQVADHETVTSVATGLQAWSEDQRRRIGISTISVVTRLALEFRMEEVTRLTVSIFLQRLRFAEPTVEAAINHSLVDLALEGSSSSFLDIIRAFSVLSRTGNKEDRQFSSNMLLAAQTKLAQKINRRPELYPEYLTELLILFSDKGIAIQSIADSPREVQVSTSLMEDMISQLAALLLPIDALLSHDDFNPQIDASSQTVSLFRNMWFLSVLFGFTSSNEQDTARDWQKSALIRLAQKTPFIVLEAAPDYIASDLEYNSVIRHHYATKAISHHRSLLSKHLPNHAHEVRHLPPAQVIFLLAVHDLESMRSAIGLPSSLAVNFCNVGLNNAGSLSDCLEAVADKVIRGCISDLTRQVVQHALPHVISQELQQLLVYSTHRIQKVRDIASRYLNRLISSFPSLMCDSPLVFAILEVLSMLRKACEGEFTDEYNPAWEFKSDMVNISISLPDSYRVRNSILSRLYHDAHAWFDMALSRAPIEFQSTLRKYLSNHRTHTLPESVELGASVALQFTRALAPGERKIAPVPATGLLPPDRARALANEVASFEHYVGEAAGLRLANRPKRDELQKMPPETAPSTEIQSLKSRLLKSIKEIRNKTTHLKVQDLKRLLFRTAATIIALPQPDFELLHYIVTLPFELFTPAAISTAIQTWTWIIVERPDVEIPLMVEINAAWLSTINHKKGLFSSHLDCHDPFYDTIEYSPTDRALIDHTEMSARRLLTPHSLILTMLLSRFQAARYDRPGLMLLILRLVLKSARAFKSLRFTNPLAREARFSFLLFGFEALKSSQMDYFCEHQLREALYNTALSWFSVRPQWSYGANRVQIEADISLMNEFLSLLETDAVRGTLAITSLVGTNPAPRIATYSSRLRSQNTLLKLLVENELFRLNVWSNPTHDARRGLDHVSRAEKALSPSAWPQVIGTAWRTDPAIAVHLAERFKLPNIEMEVARLIRANTRQIMCVPEALRFLIGTQLEPHIPRDLKLLLLWDPVPPVTAITYFQPRYRNDPILLQYGHRVLAQHPVGMTFFFVPQVVQALRDDALGYVGRFILETAAISQLFCHQIIWNMNANCYRGDLGEEEDPMKPALDQMTKMVVSSLSGEAKAFYDLEFGFFDEVTSISGKLRPFIKRSKPEKKAKIDEEMAKLKVSVGVYLPSNPDGKVVDIDKKSGRPLQSHAKAPFMATFKVRKERIMFDMDPDSVLDGDASGEAVATQYDVWQAAIFKVGDDCRQDVLALQVIAMFKNIFNSVGLTLYLYPYRVTATAPGCGVIDVVPNATSRDEMGRAKINDLMGFFVSKYGGQDTVAFQRARLNFIQSMAAYSLACYILQIKDRHNGNIMIDGEGHIVHIDFGFLFDIDEYLGVKFEPSSFKLNHEMVVLMGGRDSQGYALFQQLTIKAFLAIRPHSEQLISTVHLMLGTGLPSFKGEPTIKRLRDRFALHLNERQASEWMAGIVKNAHENVRSTVYDEFQRLQNGIPYA
ncbi:atypical/PIKK/PI4K protein kinase [Sistotremastrum niveocremeum HHB9708]|uniref:1-phosphatidylinositol 4-kinase n=1 Tax=Sistotremastrum niveocremeum HHB9708 TaxID=1314777 RepID=A0A164XGH6_9AGAM|nr:atypical/PIKK/PI4K protein kinase [Sistotremastrum niveocremeum HHB9708]